MFFKHCGDCHPLAHTGLTLPEPTVKRCHTKQFSTSEKKKKQESQIVFFFFFFIKEQDDQRGWAIEARVTAKDEKKTLSLKWSSNSFTLRGIFC